MRLPSQTDLCSYKYSFILDNFFRKLFQNPEKIIGPYLQNGDTAVDIGCGPGFFSMTMARRVGRDGKVYAVDLQEEMLNMVRRKAEKEPANQTIHTVRCAPESLNLPPDLQADFILAYYMVHETRDFDRFFSQVRPALKPGGQFLVVEPPFHVSAKQFSRIEESATAQGFTVLDRPEKKGGRCLLLGA